jgi:hypothetical protein
MHRGYLLLGVALVAVLIGIGVYFFMPAQLAGFNVALEPPAKSPVAAVPVEESRSVTFRVLDTGSQAVGAPERKNYAVYSATAFAKLWRMAHGADAVPPTVDFSKEYVIGVFAGEKSTGGYAIEVASVSDTAAARTVLVTITKPGAGCMASQSITSPYQIIAVAQSDLTLDHADTEVASPCN